MNRCSKCILPADYPGVELDAEGVCNHCRNYDPETTVMREKELLEILNSVPRGGPYDVVVPLSGGKDSTYILYYAVKMLGLKAIAVNYDNGYQTETANRNIVNACRALDVPVEMVRSPERLQSWLLRLAVKISRIRGRRFYMCGNCGIMLRVVSIKVARRHRVPFVFWGGSAIETPDAAMRYEAPGRLGVIVKSVLRKFASRDQARTFLRMLPWLILISLTSMLHRLRLGVPLNYVFRPFRNVPFPEKPRFVHFYDYIVWDTMRGAAILKEELGWTHPPDRSMRFDCDLHWFGNYEYLRQTNLSGDGEVLCRFVREGKMSRDQAVRQEAAICGAVEEECRRILRGLGLRDTERIW